MCWKIFIKPCPVNTTVVAISFKLCGFWCVGNWMEMGVTIQISIAQEHGSAMKGSLQDILTCGSVLMFE
jgi:hypothetical protein